jgi:hypothetical protein
VALISWIFLVHFFDFCSLTLFALGEKFMLRKVHYLVLEVHDGYTVSTQKIRTKLLQNNLIPGSARTRIESLF